MSPTLDYLVLLLRSRYHRARSEEPTLGASAVEWVVISAILVGIAIAVGLVLKTALTNKANQISTQIGGAQ